MLALRKHYSNNAFKDYLIVCSGKVHCFVKLLLSNCFRDIVLLWEVKIKEAEMEFSGGTWKLDCNVAKGAICGTAQ